MDTRISLNSALSKPLGVRSLRFSPIFIFDLAHAFKDSADKFLRLKLPIDCIVGFLFVDHEVGKLAPIEGVADDLVLEEVVVAC